MEELAENLLRERNLKITHQRILILSILLNNTSKAYSSSELLQSLSHQMNRSTIYRSLEMLLKNDLVLKMIDINGSIIYKLNLENKCKHEPHPHLKCNECGKLECLPAIPIEYMNILQQSGVYNLNIILGGTCTHCSMTKKKYDT